MNCQMIRVISSPSISTTGFFTLIFAMSASHLLRARSRAAAAQSINVTKRNDATCRALLPRLEIGRNHVRLSAFALVAVLSEKATARLPGGIDMTTIVLNRRNILAAGGSVLAAGLSGLLLPSRAQGLAPTESMSGGSNNYRKGAPIVNRIGKGGFWMSGTVRRAGDGTPLAGQRIQIWAHTTEGQEHEPQSHGATL